MISPCLKKQHMKSIVFMVHSAFLIVRLYIRKKVSESNPHRTLWLNHFESLFLIINRGSALDYQRQHVSCTRFCGEKSRYSDFTGFKQQDGESIGIILLQRDVYIYIHTQWSGWRWRERERDIYMYTQWLDLQYTCFSLGL